MTRPTISARRIELRQVRRDVTQQLARCRAPGPAPMPSRSVSACIAISAAAPPVKPRNAAGEMKLRERAEAQRADGNCITPTSTVTASTSWM